MRKNSIFVLALITAVFLIPNVLAALSITDSAGTDITQIAATAAHNTAITLPTFFLKNTEAVNLANITMTIGRITNASDLMNVDITDINKKTIIPGGNNSYTISPYNIPQYLASGTYTVPINVAGVNTTGTSFSDSINAVITVNETKSMSVSTNSLSVSSTPGNNMNTTFVLTNDGNKNLTGITFTQVSVMKDTDNDEITLGISSDKILSLLQPGQSATITVSASPSSNINTGSYSTSISINSTEGASLTVAYSIGISQGFCEKGKKGGFFEIDITSPDSGDDFYPYDIIPIEVKVRNDDNDERDVVIVANVFDVTDGSFLDDEVSIDGSVSDDSYEYFSLDYKLQLDVKDTHDYKLYVKVYEDGEEETQCNEDYTTIDIKKETHDLVIDKIQIPDSVGCNENLDVTLSIANIGKKDEDVKVILSNPELKINEEKTVKISKESKKSVVVSALIPKDAIQGNHTLKIQAFFQLSNDVYGNSITKTQAVNVAGNCVTEQPNLALTSEVIDTPYNGQQFSVRLNLFNTGDQKATYIITASGFEAWGRLDKIEPSVLTIDPSETASAYVYLTPNSIGSKSFKLKVGYGNQKIEKDINVDIQEKASAPKAYQGFITRLSNLTGFDLVTVNVVLVIAIILILMWIIRVRRTY